MKKVTMLLLVVLLFAAGSVLAQHGATRGLGSKAGMHKKMHGSKSPFGNPSLKDISLARADLNLSDEQVKKLDKLHHDFMLAQVDRRATASKARIELNRLKRDESAPLQSVMNAIDNLSKADAEVKKAQFRYSHEMKSVLTQEQLEKWQEYRKGKRSDIRNQLRHRWPVGLGQLDDDDDWDDDEDDDDDDDNDD